MSTHITFAVAMGTATASFTMSTPVAWVAGVALGVVGVITLAGVAIAAIVEKGKTERAVAKAKAK